MDKMKKAYIRLFVGFGLSIVVPIYLIYLFEWSVCASMLIVFVNGYAFGVCLDSFREMKKLYRYVDRVSHKEELCAKIDELILFLEEEGR